MIPEDRIQKVLTALEGAVVSLVGYKAGFSPKAALILRAFAAECFGAYKADADRWENAYRVSERNVSGLRAENLRLAGLLGDR